MTQDDGINVGAEIIAQATKVNRITSSLDKVGRIALVTGRGGTGKSSFTALLSRYLKPPLLLLDIDPDQNLGAMLGVDPEEGQANQPGFDSPLKTISDLTSRIEDEDAFTELGGGPPTVKIPMLLQWYTQSHSERFDIISLGPKWTMGDYRSANFLFEFAIPALGDQYANIVIDSPAGLEHLNRRVVAKVNDLFIVLDPSRKSRVHIDRVKRITQEVGMSYDRLFLVGNYEFDAEAEEAMKDSGETYLGKTDFDPALKQSNLRGESLLDLPDDSPACVSMRRIMEKAGYEADMHFLDSNGPADCN